MGWLSTWRQKLSSSRYLPRCLEIAALNSWGAFPYSFSHWLYFWHSVCLCLCQSFSDIYELCQGLEMVIEKNFFNLFLFGSVSFFVCFFCLFFFFYITARVYCIKNKKIPVLTFQFSCLLYDQAILFAAPCILSYSLYFFLYWNHTAVMYSMQGKINATISFFISLSM